MIALVLESQKDVWPLISNVVHKAFIEVSEEETVASAATAVLMKRGSVRRFNVDRPLDDGSLLVILGTYLGEGRPGVEIGLAFRMVG